jgi:hypothetical protein
MELRAAHIFRRLLTLLKNCKAMVNYVGGSMGPTLKQADADVAIHGAA